ncbi:MAG: hypothetical protein EZS28_010773 [Streblomastix strix]|uniref:Uncharacterized protein n=1 Tax=Streblomastix strix TaxID=222440 RepID=A0A5J4WHD4_9EUKA|nr:MAG: hypothetical protein EZS28_010773 [Streblomastix strix]
MKDGSWQINASMINVHVKQVEIIFKLIQNLNVYPIEWIRSWYEGRSKKDKNKQFLWLTEKKRIATYEEASKAVHLIIIEAAITNNLAGFLQHCGNYWYWREKKRKFSMPRYCESIVIFCLNIWTNANELSALPRMLALTGDQLQYQFYQKYVLLKLVVAGFPVEWS